MMKNYGKKIGWALLILLIGLQFYRPAKNNSADSANDISTKYEVPENVMSILKPACLDCHSNQTRYPWYAEIQPVGIWLAQHVKEGKKHLNFSEFTHRKIAYQNHKFEEIMEVLKEKEMPLASYTWTHKDAILSDEQREVLTAWASANMDSLKAQYPADSLVMRRK
jgi:hypothetical protein